jgi:DNA helicase-2/ATP-dependent DNA helicase PcrA
MSMTWSNYQGSIFDELMSGASNLIIEAVAGSGKTATIEEGAKRVKRHHGKTPLFLAFNKAIAEELKKRGLDAATLHSLGFRAWKDSLGKAKCLVDTSGKKVQRIIDGLDLSLTQRKRFGDQLWKVVNFAKQYGIVPDSVDEGNGHMGCIGVVSDTIDEWITIIDHHAVEFKEYEDKLDCIEAARAVLRINLEQKTFIDFNDMMYMPVAHCVAFATYDWVFVDESQDVSLIQLIMLDMTVAPDGNLVAVGDPFQSIYGFRGADSRAMARIRERFECKVMPLSITYRCAAAIVREAQKLVPHIEARPNAPEGIVQTLRTFAGSFLNPRTDMVVCRNTAPLVKLAYGLIAQRIPVKVLGRDIGKGLTTLIKGLKPTSMGDLYEKLDQWENQEREAALKAKQESRAESISDKAECIRAVASGTGALNVADLIASIEALFSDDTEKGGKVILCTVHKAKGLEAERVFILNRFLMPSKWAKQDWEIEQERNIEYVAITRAKMALYYIHDKGLTTNQTEPAAEGEVFDSPQQAQQRFRRAA